MKKTITCLYLITLMGCSSIPNFFGNRDVASSNTDIYPYRVTSNIPHDMRIINNGTAALFERIRMIREAKYSLELEYFIFNPDSAGRIVVKELAKAAKRGVKVRVLVDKSMAVFVLDEYYAKVFKENNIEIRYYNAASALRISSVQFRNHRKLIVRDNVEAITGGRNIADEYFNLAHEFNFLDRDIWVKGEVVNAMKETFDLYWNSDIVQVPKAIKPPRFINVRAYNKKMQKARELVADNKEDDKTLEYVLDYGSRALQQAEIHKCPEVVFATDKEGASFLERLHSDNYNTNYRLLRKEIAKWMSKIDDEIIMDSPYFLSSPENNTVLSDLFKANKRVTILTNSLGSTDAIYVSALFNDTVKKYTSNPNFNAYIYKGQFSGESEVYSDVVKNSQWGTHSKTIVYSDNAFMVGTYNIDNRSNFYNTEMALFCGGSPELTQDIKDSIQTRMKMSHHLDKDGKPDDGSSLLGGSDAKKKALYFFLKIPSKLLEFLL